MKNNFVLLQLYSIGLLVQNAKFSLKSNFIKSPLYQYTTEKQLMGSGCPAAQLSL